MFTRTSSLSWARWIQFTPSHPISFRFIFILISHLCPGLPYGLFTSGFCTNSVRTSLLFHVCYTPCPPHLLWFDHCNYIG
jgi:hypothetical protein